jgi:ribonuclease J
MNRLCLQGARVTHAGIEPGIHASGHAARAQQRRMVELTRPRHFIPIHGEPRHLQAHLALARAAGVPSDGLLLAGDGDVIQFQGGRGGLSGAAPAGRRLLARGGNGELSEHAVRQRRAVGEAGLVVATVVLDRESGALLTGPRLSGQGLTREEDAALPHLADPIRELFLGLSPSERQDQGFAESELAAAVRRVVRERLARRPQVLAQLVKL